MLTEQTVYIMKKRSCGEDLNAPGEKTKKKKVPDFSRTFLGWWSQQDSNCAGSFNFNQKHNMQYNDEIAKYNILWLHVPK